MLFAILIASLILIFGYKLTKAHFYWKDKGVPYLTPWPLVGNFGSNVFRRNNLIDTVINMYKASEGKRYVGIYLLLKPTLLIRDIELIKKLAVKEFDTFPDHRPLATPDVDPIGGRLLVSLTYDQGWHDMRATLSPSFTSSKMKIMFKLMEDCADQLVEYFSKKVDFVTVNVKDVLSRVANDMIATTAFGINCNSLENPNDEFYLKGKSATVFSAYKFLVVSLSNTIIAKIFKLKFFSTENANFYRNIISKTIQYREENNIVRRDMLHLLLQAKKGRKVEDGDPDVIDTGFAVAQEYEYGKSKQKIKAKLDDDDLTAQAVIFLLAGLETVSSSLTHLLYELAVNPDVQKKLHDEVSDISRKTDGKITYEQLLKMKYLDCVISESLRMRTIGIAIDRVSVKPYTIEAEEPGETSVYLPIGSTIWVPVWAIHHDPKYYPNPEKFDPERFNDENKHKIKPFTYMPFGLGPRNCIGSRFALLEMKLVLFKFLQNFEVVPVEKTVIPFKLDKSGLNIVPKAGIWLGIKKRVN